MSVDAAADDDGDDADGDDVDGDDVDDDSPAASRPAPGVAAGLTFASAGFVAGLAGVCVAGFVRVAAPLGRAGAAGRRRVCRAGATETNKRAASRREGVVRRGRRRGFMLRRPFRERRRVAGPFGAEGETTRRTDYGTRAGEGNGKLLAISR
jgi:hypothetical protein